MAEAKASPKKAAKKVVKKAAKTTAKTVVKKVAKPAAKTVVKKAVKPAAKVETKATATAPKKISVTLIRSKNGRLASHKGCVAGLGLRRIHQTVEVNDTPENRGMINRVRYLLNVEEA
ncbi:MAG: 50S ribosomal protein L30 [Gammaproteobacteria bacterium]|nr:50S ribosomal protein L30 [Gammaproteobacteria bacterium]MCZ6578617.1 50S ribosomal protein L30 [Gammaproteobacteria bacterium]